MFSLFRDKHFIGEEAHRSGWPWIIAELQRRKHVHGIPFDDFVEQTLNAGEMPKHQESWVGMFHAPPRLPKHAHLNVPLGYWSDIASYANNPWFKPYRSRLKMALCLAPDLAEVINKSFGYQIPVGLLKHPIKKPRLHFDPAVLRNKKIHVIHFGHYLKNTNILAQVNPGPTFEKYAIVSGFDARLWWHNRVCKMFPNRETYSDVNVISRLNDQDMEETMSRCVVCFEYIAVAASNALLECIIRNTPVIVNRMPANEFYLGKDYPLFYDSFSDIYSCFDRHRLMAAHAYLEAMPKRDLELEYFADSLEQMITKGVYDAATITD